MILILITYVGEAHVIIIEEIRGCQIFLLEYLATTDLNISNKGNKPTFVVTGRQEVIDITLVTSNPRATRWDAYIADLEEAMGGRIRRIWTEEDIENEVAFIQESIDT